MKKISLTAIRILAITLEFMCFYIVYEILFSFFWEISGFLFYFYFASVWLIDFIIIHKMKNKIWNAEEKYTVLLRINYVLDVFLFTIFYIVSFVNLIQNGFGTLK